MFSPLRSVRRWLIKLLEDTEDEIPGDFIPPIPLPNPNERATVKSLQNNHIYHLTAGHNHLAESMNGVHIRIGRIEAKLGFQLALQVAIFGAVFGAVVKVFFDEAMHSIVRGLLGG